MFLLIVGQLRYPEVTIPTIQSWSSDPPTPRPSLCSNNYHLYTCTTLAISQQILVLHFWELHQTISKANLGQESASC